MTREQRRYWRREKIKAVVTVAIPVEGMAGKEHEG